jgi:hypothetical protein
MVACHVEVLLKSKSAGSAPANRARHKPLDFKGVFGITEAVAEPHGNRAVP